MENYKNMPSVNDILEYEKIKILLEKYDRQIVKKIINDSIYGIKLQIEKYENTNKDDFFTIIYGLVEEQIYNIENRFQKIINATGIIAHTNIGRSSINKKIIKKAMDISTSYMNLEYDMTTNTRLDRNEPISDIIRLLTGAQASIVVNNNAAALMLIANTFASFKNIILSRGEIIEIGDSFRIIDVLQATNANVSEVGSTNRTYAKDYDKSIDDSTGFVLKVSKSNYKIDGFVSEVSAKELVDICKDKTILVEDLGSGNIVKLEKYGLENTRTVGDAINDGVDIVCFSTDKMLSSCQGAIISGKKEYIQRLRKNPMFRALRVGKNTITILYETLKIYLKNDSTNIPMIAMISQSDKEIFDKAEKLYESIKDYKNIEKIKIEQTFAYLGGGISEELSKKSYAVVVKFSKITASKAHSYIRKRGILPYIKRDLIYFDMMCIDNNGINTIKNTIYNLVMK